MISLTNTVTSAACHSVQVSFNAFFFLWLTHLAYLGHFVLIQAIISSGFVVILLMNTETQSKPFNCLIKLLFFDCFDYQISILFQADLNDRLIVVFTAAD